MSRLGAPADALGRGYAQFNISGMRQLRAWLMPVLDIDTEPGIFPNTPDTWSDSEVDEFYDWSGSTTSTDTHTRNDYNEFRAKRERYLSQRSRDTSKIPIFKFGSNDGWIVTPEECLILADALGKIDPTTASDCVDYWRSKLSAFAEFCRDCARYSGFGVY